MAVLAWLQCWKCGYATLFSLEGTFFARGIIPASVSGQCVSSDDRSKLPAGCIEEFELAEFNTTAVACSGTDDRLFLVFCGGTEIGLTREMPFPVISVHTDGLGWNRGKKVLEVEQAAIANMLKPLISAGIIDIEAARRMNFMHKDSFLSHLLLVNTD
ncbi:hypothetical protein AAC387_Pa03g4166 [Persea americana]